MVGVNVNAWPMICTTATTGDGEDDDDDGDDEEPDDEVSIEEVVADEVLDNEELDEEVSIEEEAEEEVLDDDELEDEVCIEERAAEELLEGVIIDDNDWVVFLAKEPVTEDGGILEAVLDLTPNVTLNSDCMVFLVEEAVTLDGRMLETALELTLDVLLSIEAVETLDVDECQVVLVFDPRAERGTVDGETLERRVVVSLVAVMERPTVERVAFVDVDRSLIEDVERRVVSGRGLCNELFEFATLACNPVGERDSVREDGVWADGFPLALALKRVVYLLVVV